MKLRAFLTVLVLLLSIGFLLWGFWPPQKVIAIISFPAGSLIVP